MLNIKDVKVELTKVEGFPQLRTEPPSLEGLAEILERFSDFDTMIKQDRATAGDAVKWFFDTFARDEDGEPLEGVDTPKDALSVPLPIFFALLNAAKGKDTETEAAVPETPLPEPES